MSTPDLSICIINHKTPALTRQCLQSIADTAGDLAIEVLVVNNTADVCDVAGIRRPGGRPLEVAFIQNAAPLGFSANQNQMLRRATGRYLMPLNSDIVIHPGALQDLVAFMDAHPRCGLAGPKLLHGDGSLQRSCRTFPTGMTCLLETSGLWRLVQNNRCIARRYALADPHDRPREVDWLSGACLIARAEVFGDLGGYDEALLPMYAEDLDWCWRIRREGWEVRFDPAAVMTHLENATPMDDRAVIMQRATYDFVRARYPTSRWGEIRVGTALGLAFRWILSGRPEQRAALRRRIAMRV